MNRIQIAHKYLHGNGIEIGALNNPLGTAPDARVTYLDRMTREDLYKHYPELGKTQLVNVDIIDNGEILEKIKDGSQDFLIANHFIEHSEDPIGTLINFSRVLVPGGIIFLAVPNMLNTFDCNRPETSIEHIMQDYYNGAICSREQHYYEWASLVEPHFQRTYNKTELRLRVDELMNLSYSIHFHCWTENGFKNFLKYINSSNILKIKILDFFSFQEEFIFILKK